MDYLYIGIIIVLLIIVIALLLKVRELYGALDNIVEDFREILVSDTNNGIRVNTSDKHVRKLAMNLNKELKNLREASIKYSRGNNELKTAIVNVSHDLRTPLTAISGYLDLLESEDKTPDVAKYLNIIGERVEVLKSLTEELFKYSVVASTTEEFSPETLVLNSELETALAALYGAFVDRGITPEVVIPEVKVTRQLDKKSLQRTLSNILSNALKYSEGNLYVELKENGEIIFRNKASNIDAIDVGRLFDRFFTVDSSHHSTGLGLSIARLLTEKNGGEIGAELINGELVIKILYPEVTK
ncbi:MAG: HAMP domain-containing histidine kinase [Saccharofermentans sp.]|nr:HAMP domain-containing histidine kinase [Saccharofermentans sp.]